MHRKALALAFCVLLAASGCGAPESPDATSPSPSATSGVTTLPSRSAQPSLDADLVASHEAACQAEFAGRKWAGMRRVLVAQPPGHAVHVYFDGTETAFCIPDPTPRYPDAVFVNREPLSSEGNAPYVSSMSGGGLVSGDAFRLTIIYGQVDSVVAGLEMTVRDPGPDPSQDRTWRMVALIQDGWYLFVNVEEPLRDNYFASWFMDDWMVIDWCGRVISNVTLGDAPTPCPPPA
jgi:hypothetical protein